jgi:hypothetical protein
VLAYDSKRVIEALGGRASGTQAEDRGRAYLEKIVQLQIPLPVIFSSELARLPDFRGATMHEATEWHDVVWPKPPSKKAQAQDQVYAYERLKLEMERLKKHEDEQNFFRRELRARRTVSRPLSVSWLLNFAYQVSSNYGVDVMRPMLWLVGVFVAGVMIFALAPIHCGARMSIRLAVKLSFANIFVFLPDKREIMTTDMINCLSDTTRAISAIQSVLGVLLLFLVGLALRNRFRMK